MEPLKYMNKEDIMFNRFIILFANFLLNAFGIEVKLLCICLHSSRPVMQKLRLIFSILIGILILFCDFYAVGLPISMIRWV